MTGRGGRALAVALGGLLAALGLTACSGAPPQIVGVDPATGSTGVAADASITVTFDHTLDRESVATRVHLDPPLTACPNLAAAFSAPPYAACHVEWRADSAAFTLLHPTAIFRSDTRYTVTVDPGVADTAGVSNGLDHHWSMTTGPAPSVRGLTPGDGATGVTVDSSLVLSFSAPMDPGSTEAALSVTPAVAGTRIVANQRDPSRFTVLFGTLLAPHTAYTVTVGATATDAHGAPLDRATTERFTTGSGLRPGSHAVVLARRPGELVSAVLLVTTAPAAAGDPLLSATVLEAPRCGADGCGRAVRGDPLEAYLDAAISPDGGHLAVIARDLAAPVASDRLELLDLQAGGPPVVAGSDAAFPAWSPDGRLLAFGSGGGVDLIPVSGGPARSLPSGDRLAGRPDWSADGALLALPGRDAAGSTHVDLADPVLGIRYPVPGLPAAATSPVLSADGSLLAVGVAAAGPGTGGTWLVHLRTGDAAPRQLGDTLTPVGFSDSGSLVALEHPAGSDINLVRVSLPGGDTDRLVGSLGGRGVSGVVTGDGGHILGFVQPDGAGIPQAWVENADGSNPVALTAFLPGSFAAVAVALPD